MSCLPKYKGKIFSSVQELKNFLNKEINNKVDLAPNIKEGVSELFESNPELANAVYEALGFKTESSSNTITRDIKEELPFKVIGNYNEIDEGLIGRKFYEEKIGNDLYRFEISNYSYPNEDGSSESFYDIDFTVNGSEEVIGTGFFDKAERAKQILQALLSQNFGNDTVRFNVEESKKGKQRLSLYKRLMNQLGYNPSGEMEYALFYNTNTFLSPSDKIVFGHPTIGKSYLKQKGNNEFITLDDDYADEVNAFVDANRGSETRQEYKGRKPKEYNQFMLNLFDRLKIQAQKEGKKLFVSNTNILKERMSDFDKVITMPKDEFKKRFDARGATYGFEDWKSDIDATVAKVPINKIINTTGYLSDLFKPSNEIGKINLTPQQKQQAQQLYSKYLDTIFPDSKVKDVVYRGGNITKEEFKDSEHTPTDYMDLGIGLYLTPNKKFAENYGTPRAVLVNIKNPKDISIAKEERIEYGRTENNYGIPRLDSNSEYDGIVDLSKPFNETYELVVFEPEQIHILGSKQDIEEFKEFVNNEESVDLAPKSLIQLAQFHNINTSGFGNLKNPAKQQLTAIEQDFYRNGYSNIEVKANRANDRGEVNGFHLLFKGKKFNPHDNTVKEFNDNKVSNTGLDTSRDSIDLAPNEEKYKKVLDNLDIKQRRLYENQKKLAKLNLKSEEAKVREEIEILNAQIKTLKANRIFENLAAIADYEFAYIEDKINGDISKMQIYDVELLALTIDNWSQAINYLAEDELDTSDVESKFAAYQIRASKLAAITTDIRIKLLEAYIQKEAGNPQYKLLDDFVNLSDVNKAQQNVMDITRVNSELLSIIGRSLMKADGVAQRQTAELLEKFEQLFTAAEIADSNYAQLFLQRFSDGTSKTGNLVHNYSQEYFDAMKYFSNLVKKAENKAQLEEATKKRNKFRQHNIVTLDYTLLYNNETSLFDSKHTDVERDLYIQELKNTLGEPLYNKLKKDLDAKLDEFKEFRRESIAAIMADKTITVNDKAFAIAKWNMQFNPLLRQQASKNNEKLILGDEVIKFLNYRAFIEAPKKFIRNKNGVFSKSKWYDKNYEAISNNPALLELHTEILNLFKELKSYLPDFVANDLQINTIPTIEKSIVDQFKSSDGYKGGLMVGAKGILDELTEQRRTRENKDIHEEKDLLLDNRAKQTLIPNIKGLDHTRVKTLMKIYELEWLDTLNGVVPTAAERAYQNELNRRKATNLVANEKSEDFRKILKTYTLMVLSYRHRSAMEDHARLTYAVLNNLQESVKDSDDNNVRPKLAGDSFKRLKVMYEDWFQVFYGNKDIPTVKFTGNKLYHGRKVSTFKEKEELALIEKALEQNEAAYNANTITPKDYLANKTSLEDRKKDLSGVKTLSKDLDLLMKFLYLKGLAFNFVSATNNGVVGFFNNVSEAAGGEIVSENSYYTGIAISYGISIQNRDQREKALKLMEKTDLLKSIVHEAFNQNSVGASKRFKVFVPFYMQKHAEKINQMPLLIAHFLDTNINDLQGNTRTLLDAFDDKGNWKVSEFGEAGEWDLIKGDKMANLIAKVEQHVAKVHGNYNPNKPKSINRKAYGRMLMMYRTWMPEAIANMVESEKEDKILGTNVKGRLASLRSVVKSFYKNGVNGYRDGNISALDKANMKKNGVILLELLTVYLLLLTLGKLFGDDDDDKDENNFVLNYVMNLLRRSETDLTGLIDPAKSRTLLRNISPVTKFMDDLWLFKNAIVDTAKGEGEWKRGVYAGQNKLWVRGTNLLPIIAPIKQNIKSATTVAKDNKWLLETDD